MMYDSAIIGTGPAGLSAALNLKIHGKSFVWFGPPTLSRKIERAEAVHNYPGLSSVSGQEMTGAFLRQVRDMGMTIEDRTVTTVLPSGGRYALMAGDAYFEARTLLLATGVASKAALPGEEALLGRGVSYCATCDGLLYRGKTIAVLSSDRRFAHEVEYLAGLAEKVYFFPTYKAHDIAQPNTEVLLRKIEAVEGEGRVKALLLDGGERLPIDGLFCLRDSISLSTLLPGLKSEDGHITVDRQMATNLPGCFAAGDCTGRPYQYAKAVGEGNIAAHSILAYLSENEEA